MEGAPKNVIDPFRTIAQWKGTPTKLKKITHKERSLRKAKFGYKSQRAHYSSI